jgi:hypothetical protein
MYADARFPDLAENWHLLLAATSGLRAAATLAASIRSGPTGVDNRHAPSMKDYEFLDRIRA